MPVRTISSARRLRSLVVAALLAAALAGCVHSDRDSEERAPHEAASRVVTVVERGVVAASWVVGDRLVVRGARTRKLRADVNATLIATLAPVAVASVGADSVAYNSWRARRPTLRVHDVRTGAESILDEGAHSVAWARDGKLAYFKALRPDVRFPRAYLGHVAVRRSRRAAPRPWTVRPGRYVVAAWARGRVLFYRLGESFPDLRVLDRPRRQRLLARGSALVAVSADGRRAFVNRYRASPPLVRIIDIRSGGELARLRVDAGDVGYVVESGSWAGNRVFAPTTKGIAVFQVSGSTIALEQVLRAGRTFPLGLSEPRVAADGRTVVAWGQLEGRPRQAVPQAGLVECDRVTLRCVRAAVASAAAPPRPVYNPSRP